MLVNMNDVLRPAKQGKYAVIKKWFLDHYQKEYDMELENLKLEKELEGLAAAVEETEESGAEEFATLPNAA